jgi:hypothetical protein
LGFGPVWCNLLFKLLRSCSTRVLVNGEPDDLILHQRGLRYGEPLSPMLFILVMDVLNSLVMKASQQGLLQPLMGGGRGRRISVYADDVVLFLRPQPTKLSLVRDILKVFGEVSGLVTNFSKCSFTQITCEEHEVQAVQQVFPCNLVQFPCKYLGSSSSKKVAQNCLFIHWLPCWKASLSPGKEGHSGQGGSFIHSNLHSDRDTLP